MNLSDVYTRVQRTFGDEAAIQINKDDVGRWCTDAQREIAIAANLLETSATTTLPVDTLTVALPPDMLTLITVTANGKPIKQVPFADGMNLAAANETADEPVCYFTFAKKINFYPTATQDVEVVLFYSREPTVVGDLNEDFDLPVAYHGRILEYCMKQAYELDENYQASTFKGSEMASNLETQVNQESWGQQQQYPTITVLPEDM